MVLEIFPYLDKKSIEEVINLLPVKINNYYDLFFSNSLLVNYIIKNKRLKGNCCLNYQSKELSDFWNYFFKRNPTFIAYFEDLNRLLITSTITMEDLQEHLSLIYKYLDDETDIPALTHFLDEIDNIFTYHNTLFLEGLKLKIDHINQNINFNIMNNVDKWLNQKKKPLTNQIIIKNINTAIKSAIYKEIINIYNQHKNTNSPQLSVMFCYLQMTCYPYKYRYNLDGDFIVPYGGAAYDNLNFKEQLRYLNGNIGLFSSAVSYQNYAKYLQSIADKTNYDDFILAIPPVNTDTLSYNRLVFNADDEKKLFNLLNNIKCKFLLILNKSEFTASIKEKTNLKVINIRSQYPFISKDQHYGNKEQKIIIKNY